MKRLLLFESQFYADDTPATPVSPFGLVSGRPKASLVWRPLVISRRGTSVRICFGSPISSKLVVYGHCLVTLSLTIMIYTAPSKF